MLKVIDCELLLFWHYLSHPDCGCCVWVSNFNIHHCMWTLAVSYVTNMQDLGVPAGKITYKNISRYITL